LIPSCEEAIDACTGGEYDKEIELPEGVLWKGMAAAPARAIVEEFHLDFYLQPEFYEEE
jgi:hypothetical protein